ncbi:sensor histidine kinase [Phytomonospora endophytica]|uniref:histidine kinase n=1 Tax=Phytomonospora endophytica TaxID=714109 RepID=A0A841FPQ3_9ACTN|nr:histidine kinase [Phytomonospora endophytica]MBB6035532.1 signal transduction histidine kinase [Phytomonospora endophytica]GIG70105.1 ATPase [Phytomonospora endophytica]
MSQPLHARLVPLARRGWLLLAGLATGALTAALELLFLLAAGLACALTAPFPRPRTTVRRAILDNAHRLARMETRRLHHFFGDPGASTYTGRRVLAYLATRLWVGAAGGLIVSLLAMGGGIAGILLAQLVDGRFNDGPSMFFVNVFLGLVLLFIDLQGMAGLATVEKRLARDLLGPSGTEELERRVGELAASRAAVMSAVNDERRRIERDLHDGVQQRLVALGMLLGRARRGGDPDRTAELLRQAHEETAEVLRDLREVSWRVFPTALDDGGLRPALEAVVERSVIPVRLDCRVDGRLDIELETVAYFVVSEAVTNASKHSGAAAIEVEVSRHGDRLGVTVTDAGEGGADPGGGGLSGLARRVAAVDGDFHVESPPGGPTIVRAELPCA